MFLIELQVGVAIIEKLALWPLDFSTGIGSELERPHFQISQLVTYAFLHGGYVCVVDVWFTIGKFMGF